MINKKQNLLLVLYPELAKLFHLTKNDEVFIDNITIGSHENRWWYNSICDHEWSRSPHEMTTSYRRYIKLNPFKIPYLCFICNNRKLNDSNCAATTSPWLLEIFHPTLNIGRKTLREVSHGSTKKFWWQCRYGHIYEAAIRQLVKSLGCLKCSHHVSQPQLFLYSEIKFLFPTAELGKRINGFEFDIYIKDLNVAIEYDGYPWHKGFDREQRDRKKNSFAEQMGIKLVRVRDNKLAKLNDSDVLVSLPPQAIKFDDIVPIFQSIKMNIENKLDMINLIDQYIVGGSLKNYEYYKSIENMTRNGYILNNITETHSHIAKFWGNNGVLKPEMFTAGSPQKVQWICDRNPSHVWNARISGRCLKGNVCKKCAYVNDKYNLENIFPLCAKDWNFLLNNPNVPKDSSPRSEKQVFWVCENGHEEFCSIKKRTTRGCKICNKNNPKYRKRRKKIVS